MVVGDMDRGEERRRGVSAESEVNPLRRNITCTNECAHCLSLTLQAPALVFRGLEGFLLSGGSDRLSKVHCFTHTNTRAVSVRGCVCVCVCARKGRWPSLWQKARGVACSTMSFS